MRIGSIPINKFPNGLFVNRIVYSIANKAWGRVVDVLNAYGTLRVTLEFADGRKKSVLLDDIQLQHRAIVIE